MSIARLRQVSRWLTTRPRHCAATLVLGILLLGGIARIAWFVGDVVRRLPAGSEIGTLGIMANATVIYDAFDEPVFTLSRERRLSVPLEQLSPHLVEAVIAVEDHRFYSHLGFDLIRIGGAAVAAVTSGRLRQGGSTITQQLARVSLLSRERTFRRKLAEVLTAIRIERSYTKDAILELYLNRVYFGGGFYGAEAAAQGYFGRSAAELTLGEAALLAGLIQAPGRYAPMDRPAEALARREIVLAAMVTTGVVEEDQVEQATQQTLQFQNGLDAPPEFGGYFKEEVRRRLVDRFGAEAIYQDGFHVYTTLLPDLQVAADAATTSGLHRIETLPGFVAPEPLDGTSEPDRLQAALLALDPKTGEVRAVVGGRSFAESPFNRATQAHRQPGSAFKPFLYAAAIETGVTPVTRLTELDRPTQTAQGEWLPEDGTEASALSVRDALRLSSNRAAVRLLEMTGIARTVDYAGRFALGPQPPVASLALGSGTVTLEGLTAAYGAFANRGVVPRPRYLRRIERANGEVLVNADVTRRTGQPRAVTPATAFLVSNLLRGVVDEGTGARVRREGFAAPAAGKTGTTDDYKDAWFVGFTPELVAGVWVGFDQPRTIMPGGYASDLAAPVWAEFMSAAVADEPGQWLEPPTDVVTVEVCALSGARAGDRCRHASHAELSANGAPRPTYVEYFVSGTEPLDACPIHSNRNPLGFFARLFSVPDSSHERADRPRRMETEEHAPAPETHLVGESASERSVTVIHDHVFGNCQGRLVADDHGVRYETSHKDSFTIAYHDLEQFDLDRDAATLRIRPRGGRRYNFTDDENAAEILSAFHATVTATHARSAVAAR